jgi:16S rRNA (cytosine967-C5)-methyltransferase
MLFMLEIFAQALKYLKPDGKILYSTCSLLTEENERQIEYFTKTHGLSLHNNKFFQSVPEVGGMDGFFSAILVPK